MKLLELPTEKINSVDMLRFRQTGQINVSVNHRSGTRTESRQAGLTGPVQVGPPVCSSHSG